MKFTQTTLTRLQQSTTDHPELPRHFTPFYLQVQKWRSGELGVITHQGEVLAFVMQELPEKVPTGAIASTGFNKANMTIDRFREWQKYDVVLCRFRSRFAFWLINPKHQGFLPLPEIKLEA